MNGYSDHALMGQVREGNMDAMGILFERHHRRLFHYFCRVVGERTAAEDLLQATFERMLRYRDTFRGETTFSAWMYRIASNLVADLRVRRGKEERIEPPPRPAVSSPESASAMQVETLSAAMARLEPGDREVLVLTKYQDLRCKEVSAILHCSESAVKVRVHRALKRLKKIHEELTDHDSRPANA